MKIKGLSTIRQKLMVFVVLLCGVLLGLVWLLNVWLLEPFYTHKVHTDLQRTADAFSLLIQKYETLEDPSQPNGISPDFYSAVQQPEYTTMLLGKCIEIADANYNCLLGNHALSSGQCLLHPARTTLFGDTGLPSWNNKNVLAYRAQTLADGDMYFTLNGQNGMRQMVVCKNVADRYTVIVSTDLERIGQAGEVIGQQVPLIAAVLLAVSILGAYLFSKWFTKPITELSHAAREMAKGNYQVRVREPENADELGQLARDFNTMATEVGRTSELQRDLIANVSHDLRTPLTLIKGYAETVRDLTGDDKQKRTDQLDVIVDETDRLSGLVNSVMELSKYSSGTMKMEPVRFDLAQLCDEVADRYRNVCEQNGYHLDVQTDQVCMVKADPDSMSRAIHNLLSNAIHHIGEDGYVALHVKPQADGSTRVEIIDHGAGISKEDLPYIFDKYYRSRADAGKVGTGLGLSITKAILISHGYAFGVDSELGKGSTFWFVAAAAEPEKSAEA